MFQSTVFVTGSNGFIAQELVFQLLDKGYRVIGQVRSAEKGKKLAKVVDDENFSYVVVPVLEEKGAFDKVLQEHPQIETFYHTASPLPFGVDDDFENTILIPAIKGTKYVLESLSLHAPQLKHFVYTSSVVTLTDPQNPQATVTEDSWCPITYEEAKSSSYLAYVGSKTFAEKEVWKFRQEAKPKFSIATVLPAFVLGPQAFAANISHLRSTASFIADAIESKSRKEFEHTGIDVRDVARAHIFGAECTSANGQRLVLASRTFNTDTLLKVLNKKYPGKTTIKENIVSVPLRANVYNNKRTRALLGEFITPEQSLADTLVQYCENDPTTT